MSASGLVRLVSVKLPSTGHARMFLANDLAPDVTPRIGAQVVVHADGGLALGTVEATLPQVVGRALPAPSPERVVRIATREDLLTRQKQQQREQDAHRVCRLRIDARGLEMKLVRVEQRFDGSKLIFYFTADARVDFRALVKDLAAEFNTRIEMRQIGVRDEAKLLGGFGTCGRPLCCTTFLTSFESVSIKMAKKQDLSLNQSKLSGLCGRLKCCLRFELEGGEGAQGGCGGSGGCHKRANTGAGGCSAGGCGTCGKHA